MADEKLTALTEDTAPASSDYAYTVKDPGGTPLSRRASWLNILKGAALGVLTADNDVFARVGGVLTRVPVAASRIVGRKASGDITALTGAEVGDLLGVYQAYDAVVSQNGARTTSGEVARYCQIGKQVHCYGFATITDAGTAGNVLTVSVPVTALAADRMAGGGWIFDASASDQWNVVAGLVTTTTLAFYATSPTNGNAWGVNPNLAVANGDVIYWFATYEAA